MAHILLVDQDTKLNELHCKALEKKGHKITIAHSTQEGWEALSKEVPNLMIIEADDEEFTSGFELAQDVALKYPDLSILMFSEVHNTMHSDWKFSKEKDKHWLPIEKYLEKPLPPDSLVKEVELLLAVRKK